MNRNEWMEQVLREVRFAPDRRKIRPELAEHMEDRMEEYLDAMGAYGDSDDGPNFDETLKKAEARLMYSMGNPVELGRELNQQHKTGCFFEIHSVRTTSLNTQAILH